MEVDGDADYADYIGMIGAAALTSPVLEGAADPIHILIMPHGIKRRDVYLKQMYFPHAILGAN